MKQDKRTWFCHTINCGYTTTQSASIAEVSHLCGKGRRCRELKLTPPKK